jgi:dTDP-L-rhamnose 4-epimerase
MYGPHDQHLTPRATPENKPPSLTSIYALSKYDQERLCLLVGRAYQMATVALRFFNVFGPRQVLSNPYTGVLAIFASRYLNDQPPLIFEDGYQQRDFVSVHDVVQACCLASTPPMPRVTCSMWAAGVPTPFEMLPSSSVACSGKPIWHPASPRRTAWAISATVLRTSRGRTRYWDISLV